MPRQVYHQSPGNPIQTRHLPATPAELEFAWRSSGEETDNRFIKPVLSTLLLTSGIAAAALWINIWTSSWFPINVVVIGLIAWKLFHQSANAKQQHPVFVVVLTVAAFLPFRLLLPYCVEVAVVTIATLIVSREVARHYAFVATTSPMQRDVAWRLRTSADRWTVLGSATLLPIALAGCLPRLLPHAVIASTVLVVVQAVLFWDQIPNLGTRYLDAIRSWCTYNPTDASPPGLLVSPSGSRNGRIFQLTVAVLLLSLFIPRCALTVTILADHLESWTLPVALAPSFLQMVLWILLLIAVAATPVVVVLVAVFVTSIPVLARFELSKTRVVSPGEWERITDQVRQSSSRIERDSIYMGRLVADHSPLLVPRAVFREHAHFLGDSGSGKTARGLAPLGEQLIADGKCSLMVVDLKGDTGELLESLKVAAGNARAGTKRKIPIRYFTTREDQATFAFNPFQLSAWSHLNVFQKTDILCGALGLVYGVDYGEGYFSSANASILYATLKHFPEVATFAELADRIGYVMSRPKAHGVDEQTRSAGNHVRMSMVRLASFAPLNVTPHNSPDKHVVQESLDPSCLFDTPEIHYFHLSATLGPGSSPEIGRLAIYMLLLSATLSKRDLPVYLIIDEFQRIAARNLDYMLQLARGMGVGVILANQSVQDLKHADLVSVIETNCRYRQWFAVSGWDDQDRICSASGETIDSLESVSVSRSDRSRGPVTSESRSSKQIIAPRLTKNDIKLISDDDRQSIVLVTRGAGYSQYGGMPIAVETDFHISREEFNRRKNTHWPTGDRGTFVPQEWQPEPTPTPRKGRKKKQPLPVVTQETIEDTADDSPTSSTASLFDRYLGDNPMPPGGSEQ